MATALCDYCNKPFVLGSGLTNHERGCYQNPGKRTRKRRARRTCPICRTLVDSGNFKRHISACHGRKGEEVEVVTPEVSIDIDGWPETPLLDRLLTQPSIFDAPKQESTSEILVELLFPKGLPSSPKFIRALREWLEATDRLVELASLDDAKN